MIVTADWVVTVLDFSAGAVMLDLFPAADLRTRNLAVNDQYLASWRAVKVRVVNNQTGERASFLPAAAFVAMDDSGARTANVGFLTPPQPDISIDYYPGATREGWAMLRPQDGTELGRLVRFLPFWTDPDPRYIALPESATTLTVGMSVVVGPDVANLRDVPSINGAIFTTLPPGTSLTVTGDATTADGHDWIPVTDPATDEAGYVAAELVVSSP